MTLTYDDMDTVVRKAYLPGLVDQIFIANPVNVRLMAKSKVQLKGGLKVTQPVMYAYAKGGSYSGMDTFDTTFSPSRTLAEWEWKGLWVGVTLSGWDLAKADSPEKTIDLLESEMERASMTADELLSQMYCGDGSGNSGKDFDGLENAIDDGTLYDTYGGISRTTNPWWKANVDSTGGVITTDRINAMIGKCTVGNRKPDLILCQQDIYDQVWTRVQAQQRFLGDKHKDLADVGFTGINFNGHAALMVDNHIASGTMKFINTDWWKLVLNSNKAFAWTDPKTPTNQDAYVRQLLAMGNLVCNQPRLQGQMTGLSV